jgi:ABC-type nitrate/sulfonate/bicarbonate transport system substrate-binding protein
MLHLVWAFLSVFILCHPATATDKVRISVSTLDVNFLTTGVAERRGFLKGEGLDAEVIRISSGVAISALVSANIDYTMSFGSTVRGAIVGLPIKVVSNYMSSLTHALIARPEFKSGKDLKGRTLGVSSFGAAADVAARMMIRHLGVGPEKEMKILALGSDRARLAALKEGLLDVTAMSPPADSEAKKLGFNILARAHELFSLPVSGLGVTVKKIKENPDQIKRTVKALIKANHYIRSNREGTIQVMMDWSRFDRESAAATYESTWKIFNDDGSIPEDGLRLVIEQARRSANITREVPLSEVSDITILHEAQKELGVKGR